MLLTTLPRATVTLALAALVSQLQAKEAAGPLDTADVERLHQACTELERFKVPDTWTDEDDAQAAEEGWNLFTVNCGRWSMLIQRIDAPEDLQGNVLDPKFESDIAAESHVMEKALLGSDLHAKALRMWAASIRKAA